MLPKKLLKKVPVAWRWPLGVFFISVLAIHLWAGVVYKVYPLSVNSTVLCGKPTLLLFDLRNSDAFFYENQVNGESLLFQADSKGNLIDTQSGSQWDPRTGRALSGKLEGQKLIRSDVATEEIYPYKNVLPHTSPFLAIWQRFDTNWYLKIAEKGYSDDDGSTAFFPLYPFLVRFLSFIIGDMVLASRLVSLLALLFALFFFYQVVDGYAGEAVAKRALIYIVIFPSGFFLFASYTESLFLLLVLASFFCSRKQKWLIASLLGILAALTRAVGVLIFIPLFYIWYKQKRMHHWREAVVFFLLPLGAGIYLLPNMFSSLETEWRARPVFPWEHFVELKMLISNDLLSSIDIFNMLITLLVGFLCLIMLKNLPLELSLYSLLMFGSPLFRLNAAQPFVSMLRYVLVIFPMFIFLGQWGEKAWANRLILYLSLPLSLYFSGQFWLWGWVG